MNLNDEEVYNIDFSKIEIEDKWILTRLNRTIEELTEHRAIKRQFMHDYAQELNDFIWNHLSELTPKTCVVFDLVPYTIWNVMSEKYTTIIDKIKELHQEEV